MTIGAPLVLTPPPAGGAVWNVAPPADLPVAKLLTGRPVAEALRLIPLIWNICAAAQVVAARAALGLAVSDQDLARLRAERLRDHHVKLWLVLPSLAGAAPGATRGTPRALAGETAQDFLDWMADPACAAAAAARRIWAMDPARGQAGDLPGVPDRDPDWPDAVWNGRAVDNALAPAWADHSLMRWIEDRRGRGPVWRFAARLLDFSRLSLGRAVPDDRMTARGRLFVRASAADGRITTFARITPTDCALVPGGLLSRMLAGVAADDPDMPLLTELADPCVPWTIKA